MTGTLDMVFVVVAAVGAAGRPITQWIREVSRTRRQRDAMDALERLASAYPDSAPLVADVLRAADRFPAPSPPTS